MDTLLGLIGIVIWILGVIVLAAALTWIVVKVFPGEKPGEPAEDAATES